MANKRIRKKRQSKVNNNTNSTIINEAAEIAEETVEKVAQEGIEDLGASNMKKIFNSRTIGTVFNVGFGINEYNEAREKGDGVVKAGAKAIGGFAAGEILGAAMLPVMLARSLPSAVVGGLETAQKVTRQMNSIQRIQTFGEAQFQDSQQLATMRQAGMEMAKMSQYNLQQSIMGNEAQSMHRI